jgi:hypothetical protein
MRALVIIVVAGIAALLARRILRQRRAEDAMVKRLQTEAVEGGTVSFVAFDEHGVPVEPPAL